MQAERTAGNSDESHGEQKYSSLSHHGLELQ